MWILMTFGFIKQNLNFDIQHNKWFNCKIKNYEIRVRAQLFKNNTFNLGLKSNCILKLIPIIFNDF